MNGWRVVTAFALAGIPFGISVPASGFDLNLPVACTLGEDCFVQQYPDMDPGPGALDPFCGSATYNGHDGTDLRILSMEDVARGVQVLAMASGKVLRSRDGEPDRLVVTAKGKEAALSRECGNGLVIQHDDGIEIQYCHLKQWSISVRPGDNVRKGGIIGQVGASGMAQFPHVHVTVRKDGRVIDPSTGKFVPGRCDEAKAETTPLFSRDVLARLGHGDTQILSLGLAESAIEHAQLVVSGPPPPADVFSSALVGWAWLQNLRTGDRVSVEVTGPNGKLLASGMTAPVNRTKASFSSYVGKRGAPMPGPYSVTVKLLRDGRSVLEKTGLYRVE
ncbi:M23 family metallopeptidase [Rhizobium sp. Root482]|uniref:M23 family metallopeptidase n=1 Tax=Rhizobium sp. Root482 TaxID=1736543 RepID=UPI0009E6A8DA|nr:M23 family metallopeptidase [Rhizobium sp. Root482]